MIFKPSNLQFLDLKSVTINSEPIGNAVGLKLHNVFKVPDKMSDRVCTQQIEGYYHLAIIVTILIIIITC